MAAFKTGILALLLFVCTTGQAVEPSWKFRVLRSAHFEIVYRQEQKNLAKRYLVAAEQAHEILMPIFKEGPYKTIIFIRDDTDSSNGMATFLPYPVIEVLPVTPTTLDGLDDYGDWALELILHEYTHILNMYPAHGFYAPLKYIFGSVVRPNAILPRWYLEGLAIDFESRYTDHGRMRSAETQAQARALVLSQRLRQETISTINESDIPTWPYGGRPYLFGGWWWRTTLKDNGYDVVYRWNQNFSRRLPFLINNPMFEATGKNATALFSEAIDDVEISANADLELIDNSAPPASSEVAPETGNQSVFTISPSGKTLLYWNANPRSGQDVKIKVRASTGQPFGEIEGRRIFKASGTIGDEIPCFGLTEPGAGSDAGSIQSTGVLFKKDGKIYIRLNWNKRWITLAAISTLIGLAFRLRDPENILGKGEDLGITCALIPSNLKGVVIGRRHDPLGVAFHNCPTQGHDVEILAEDAIIGGLEGAGHGWTMLMECLGAGRGVSLPAEAACSSKLASRVVGNHSVIRKQFGLPIGKFEGVEEPLARIAGTTYLLEAMRKYVLSPLDRGISPPVVTAIAKYMGTDIGRTTINDAMDVMGGAGISMGPRNLLAITYIGTPIGITVEGANILTRTLMIFGQGALRAHPYAFKEVNAVEKGDLKGFDEAFWGHIGHIVRNLTRCIVLSVTRSYLVMSPVGGPSRRYVQKINWVSASFAFMADLSMGLLGGKLKIKEKLTGRFADILGWMFIATAVIKRYEEEGRRPEDKVLLDFSMAMAFQKIQDAFDGIFANIDVPVLYWFFKGPVRWWSRFNFVGLAPTDRLTHRVANVLLQDTEQRNRLTAGIYIPNDKNEALGRLEHAFKTILKADAVDKKVRAAVHSRTLNKKSKTLLDDALKGGIITKDEHSLITEAERLRFDAIQVDDFSEEEYVSHEFNSEKHAQPSGGMSVGVADRKN